METLDRRGDKDGSKTVHEIDKLLKMARDLEAIRDELKTAEEDGHDPEMMTANRVDFSGKRNIQRGDAIDSSPCQSALL